VTVAPPVRELPASYGTRHWTVRK